MADVALVEVIDFYVDITLPPPETVDVEVVNPADPILVEVLDVGAAGPRGSSIHSGNGAPASVGNLGDMYIDTATGVFYGPKVPPGAPVYKASPLAGSTFSESSPGSNYELGCRFVPSSNCKIYGFRLYRTASSISGNITFNVWTETGNAKIGTALKTGVSGAGWVECMLAAPIDLTAGQAYMASWSCVGDVFGVVAKWPLTLDGVLYDSGWYAGPGSYPSGGNNTSAYGIEPMLGMPGAEWPVAVDMATQAESNLNWKRWTGTQAAYDAITTKDPNTLYVIVG